MQGKLAEESFSIHGCTAICDIAAFVNSDFDADHDSPKGEVNPNDFVNCNDVSDISKNTVDDNKSLPAWRALEVQTL